MVHPSAQKIVRILEKMSNVEPIGEPILPVAQIVILAFMGWKARLLAACYAIVVVRPIRLDSEGSSAWEGTNNPPHGRGHSRLLSEPNTTHEVTK